MMTNLPADLSPETAAWMHAQIAISTARAVAPLREELDKVDDWAGGLFVVLLKRVCTAPAKKRPPAMAGAD